MELRRFNMLTDEERNKLIALGIDPDHETTADEWDKMFDWEDED